jgi:hypothetical protein
MRFISTRTHGIIDYIVGALLILAPFVLGFATGGAAMWVPIILGAAIIVYSLMTAYEMGATATISMSTHLWLDVAGGVFLAISPWLFGFSGLVWAPHLIVGLLAIGLGLTTHTTPAKTAHDRRDTTTRTAA